MQANRENKHLDEGIINTLKYFHIFKHPLHPDEIHKFLGVSCSIGELLSALKLLEQKGVVYTYDGYYMLTDNEQLTTKRLTGEKNAEILLKKAEKVVAVLSHFPFVKCVCISGSLSKGYADEKTDIDLFIIAKNHRLWICRTILHVFKKFSFLLNRQHSLCMNYFIDEGEMSIEEQNSFTGTELITLLPMYNFEAYKQLINSNKYWLHHFFPNVKWNWGNRIETSEIKIAKTIGETFFNIALPRSLNQALMNMTDTWWRYKWKRKNYPMHEYDLAMKTKWYVSKNHPANYQKKVLNKLQGIDYSPSAANIG